MFDMVLICLKFSQNCQIFSSTLEQCYHVKTLTMNFLRKWQRLSFGSEKQKKDMKIKKWYIFSYSLIKNNNTIILVILWHITALYFHTVSIRRK